MSIKNPHFHLLAEGEGGRFTQGGGSVIVDGQMTDSFSPDLSSSTVPGSSQDHSLANLTAGEITASDWTPWGRSHDPRHQRSGVYRLGPNDSPVKQRQHVTCQIWPPSGAGRTGGFHRRFIGFTSAAQHRAMRFTSRESKQIQINKSASRLSVHISSNNYTKHLRTSGTGTLHL